MLSAFKLNVINTFYFEHVDKIAEVTHVDYMSAAK